MNKARRHLINLVHDQIVDSIGVLETVRDEEQDAFNNMPEGIQNGDRGATSQNAIDELESAISNLETARDELERAGE